MILFGHFVETTEIHAEAKITILVPNKEHRGSVWRTVSSVGQFHLNTDINSNGGGHSGNSEGGQEFRAPVVSTGRSVQHDWRARSGGGVQCGDLTQRPHERVAAMQCPVEYQGSS